MLLFLVASYSDAQILDVVDGGSKDVTDSESDPKQTADTCLRELTGKASFGCIKSVLGPVLQHADLHRLWVPSHIAEEIFRYLLALVILFVCLLRIPFRTTVCLYYCGTS